MVCVGPGRKPRRQGFSLRGSHKYSVYLFDLLESLRPSQQFFSHVETFSWVEQVLSNEDEVPCSWIQHRAPGLRLNCDVHANDMYHRLFPDSNNCLLPYLNCFFIRTSNLWESLILLQTGLCFTLSKT